MRHLTQSLLVICSFVLLAASPSTLAGMNGIAAGAHQPPCSTPVACQKVANVAFAAEMSRSGSECRGVSSQREETMCVGAAFDTTGRNFATFYRALENIVGSDVLRGAQKTWLDYRKTQCDAIFAFFRRGTIAPSAQIRCEIALTRGRMRDLDMLFDVQLRH